MAECVYLTTEVVKDSPVSQDELSKWLEQARIRLNKEENIRLLEVYADKLVSLQKTHKIK